MLLTILKVIFLLVVVAALLAFSVFAICYLSVFISGVMEYGKKGFDMNVSITILGHTFKFSNSFW